MSDVAYYKRYHAYGATLVVLRPTGRWRIRVSRYCAEPILEIEHRGILFRTWVIEPDIEFGPAESTTTFCCGE